jgi:hypothetical protein
VDKPIRPRDDAHQRQGGQPSEFFCQAVKHTCRNPSHPLGSVNGTQKPMRPSSTNTWPNLPFIQTRAFLSSETSAGVTRIGRGRGCGG